MSRKNQQLIMRILAIALIALGLLSLLPFGVPGGLLTAVAILTGILLLLGW